MDGNGSDFSVIQNNSPDSVLGIVCEKVKPLPKIPKNCHKPILLDKQGAQAFGMCGMLDGKEPWLWLLDLKKIHWIPKRKLSDEEAVDYIKVRDKHSLSIVKLVIDDR